MKSALSSTEENYLKTLYKLCADDESMQTGTNLLATHLEIKPATANDMLKKLKEKKLVQYEKYGKIKLTNNGRKIATEIIRKHRLWETFLYEKLNFGWDEVHEIAEQLEHIQSQKLIDRLDAYLGYPQYDPHGDSIPNARGEIQQIAHQKLTDIEQGSQCKLVAVKDNSAIFLQYAVKVGLGLSSKIKVLHKNKFDGSIEIEVDKHVSTVSEKFANNILVVELKRNNAKIK